jgi:hypothetical protein
VLERSLLARAGGDQHRYPRDVAANGKKRSAVKRPVRGRLEKGRVRLAEPVAWNDGQQVVVIPLPQRLKAGAKAPPVELLEEDAAEFARRPETLGPINSSELD